MTAIEALDRAALWPEGDEVDPVEQSGEDSAQVGPGFRNEHESFGRNAEVQAGEQTQIGQADESSPAAGAGSLGQ
jgi:hypothetical protein